MQITKDHILKPPPPQIKTPRIPGLTRKWVASYFRKWVASHSSPSLREAVATAVGEAEVHDPTCEIRWTIFQSPPPPFPN